MYACNNYLSYSRQGIFTETLYKLRKGSFFKFCNSKKVQSDEEHISIIMNRKNPANTKYATWVVSNCESTSGASQRFQYAQRLVSATDFTIFIFDVSINFYLPLRFKKARDLRNSFLFLGVTPLRHVAQ